MSIVLEAKTIGVISDTHGLLRPEALTALAGSDLIIHAGDVGNGSILGELRLLAPVVAVRGNVDQGDWADRLPLTAIVETAAGLLYILHNLDELDLNPGSAGPRRFQLPTTLALLKLRQSAWAIEFIHLL